MAAGVLNKYIAPSREMVIQRDPYFIAVLKAAREAKYEEPEKLARMAVALINGDNEIEKYSFLDAGASWENYSQLLSTLEELAKSLDEDKKNILINAITDSRSELEAQNKMFEEWYGRESIFDEERWAELNETIRSRTWEEMSIKNRDQWEFQRSLEIRFRRLLEIIKRNPDVFGSLRVIEEFDIDNSTISQRKDLATNLIPLLKQRALELSSRNYNYVVNTIVFLNVYLREFGSAGDNSLVRE